MGAWQQMERLNYSEKKFHNKMPRLTTVHCCRHSLQGL